MSKRTKNTMLTSKKLGKLRDEILDYTRTFLTTKESINLPSSVTLQVSKRGPLYSKLLDSRGESINNVMKVTVELDAEAMVNVMTVQVVNPNIEIID